MSFDSEIPEHLLGLEFLDLVTGRRCKLERWHGKDVWLFYKHPDGQWVSWRKPTRDDIHRIVTVSKGEGR